MGDIAAPNWPVDCPRLHEFVVKLNEQLSSDKQRFICNLDDAVDALAAARTYMLTWRANRPEFTELATCRTNFFEGEIAKTPALRDVDNPVEDHVWSSHERMITLQEESVIHSSHLNEFYCALRPDDRDGLSETDSVGIIKIYGWLPEYLCDLNQERLFHLPWPIGKPPTLDRKHSDHERFLALVVILEASCSFASLIPKDFIPNEGADWENWLFRHVGDVKIRASDDWVDDLCTLAGIPIASVKDVWQNAGAVAGGDKGLPEVDAQILQSRDTVRAHQEKLFPKGLPDDTELVGAILQLDTDRKDGVSDRSILRKLTGERTGDDRKSRRLAARIRKARQAGKTTLPPRC
ncbi:MAG: hypothetical protein ACR2PZ_16045 [Pseudomonadales bacterium]